MKRIYFTVTNDLTYDQRMHRICGTLSRNGYDIFLVGRKLKSSLPLVSNTYQQKRLYCFFNKGFLFYAEFNTRLFIYLMFRRMNGICAIDLDTILPCLAISKIKRISRIYDAHEYFTEMKEVRTRPSIQRWWSWVEKISVPRFTHCYTVSEGLADIFKSRYKTEFKVIRNLPSLKKLDPHVVTENYLLYQGAVNEGRGFEQLIPALKISGHRLVVCGDGNFMDQLKSLIKKYHVEHQVELRGMILPDDLLPIAQKAALGIGLAEKDGINQFHALPNKFLEYIHAGLPQISMAYPEYIRINDQFQVAILIDGLSPEYIASSIEQIMSDETLRIQLHKNCLHARNILCWESEETKLLDVYLNIFGA